MRSRFRLARARSGEMRQREVDAELRFHIEERVEELVAKGVPRAEAERRVRERFGDVSSVRAELEAIDATIDRKRSRGEWVASVTHQARLAFRALVRRPTFAVVAVGTLALGCGAATAVYTLVDAILLRPLPFESSERLVDVSNTAVLSGHLNEMNQSDALFLHFQAHSKLLENIGVYRAIDVNVAFPGDAGSEGSAERMKAISVSASFFPTLHINAAAGRLFLKGEDREGAARVMVISDAFWRRKLGSDPNAIGRTVNVHGVSREIVGILPPSFAFPTPEVQLFLPYSFDPKVVSAANFMFRGVARLKSGTTIDQAKGELDKLLGTVLEEFPSDVPPEMWRQAHVAARVRPLRDVVVGDVGQLLWILLGSGALVLIIACANVASLFMVRAEEGQHELAVRRALGAGSGAAASQYVSEAVLIALAGGVLGVVIAALAVQALKFLPAGINLPRMHEVGISLPSVLFALGTLALCAAAVSIFPLLRARGVAVSVVLREASRSSTGSIRRQRARSALVVAQVALAMVLVASSGLMARSFLRLRDVSPGFDVEHALLVRIALSSANYGDAVKIAGFQERLLRGVREIPGVQQVGITTSVPLTTDWEDGAASVEGQEVAPNEVPPVHTYAYLSDSLFRALGIPLVEGRTFSPIDLTRNMRELMVSESFAKRYWPGQSAVGKRIRQGLTGPWQNVVGVLGDVHLKRLDLPAEQTIYLPLFTPDRNGTGAMFAPRDFALIVRTPGEPDAMFGQVRALVHRLDPALPTFGERTVSDVVRASEARTRFTMLLLGVASAVALLLGAVGLYGVMAYAVSLRQREIGVRMALGARPADVRWMVSRQGIILAGSGVVIGLFASLGTTRLLQGLLYNVSPSDPITLGATCAVLLVVALLASWLPARRAAALPPVGALRGD